MLHSKFWQAFFAWAPILVGLFSIIFYIFFAINIITEVEAAEAHGEVSPQLILGKVVWFFGFIFLLIILSLSSLVFYIVHAMQNPNLKDNSLLVVWILLFVFVGGIGQLVYWGVEILGRPKPQTAIR